MNLTHFLVRNLVSGTGFRGEKVSMEKLRVYVLCIQTIFAFATMSVRNNEKTFFCILLYLSFRFQRIFGILEREM